MYRSLANGFDRETIPSGRRQWIQSFVSCQLFKKESSVGGLQPEPL